MTIKKHLMLYFITFLAWLGFYLLGIPFNYFTDWNLAELILLCLITAFGFLPVIGAFVLIFMDSNYVRTSLWFAFYSSVPLFFYDLIMVGIIGGEGLHFLASHWPLTFGYLCVWIILPLVGLTLQKFRTQPHIAS
jgi:hypothetical protein